MIRFLVDVAISLLTGIKYGATSKDKFKLLGYILGSIFIMSIAITSLGRERAIEWFRNSKSLDWLRRKTVIIRRDDILIEIPLILDYINVIKPEYLKSEANYIQRLQLGNSNEVFFDIGANMGLFSLLLAKAYPKASVISVEASLQIFEKLEKNLKLNNLGSRMKILRKAVTEKNDSLEELYENDSRSTTLSTMISNSRRFDSDQNISTVRTVTIDGLVSEYKIKEITLLKIDIEGGEVHAVLGARRSLEEQKIRNLIIEFHSIENRDFLNQFLKEHGYALLEPDPSQHHEKSDGHILARVLRD